MNTQAFCTSAKVDALAALVGTTDTIMGALYTTGATLGAGTTVYDPSGEVSGAGYTAGGIAITNANPASTDGSTAVWTPSADIVFVGVTLSDFDTLLLYNASKGGRAIAVYTFDSQTIIAGTFILTMPSDDASNALLRIA